MLPRALPRLLLVLGLLAPPHARPHSSGQALYFPIVLRPSPDTLLDYAGPPVPGVLDVDSFRIWIPAASAPIRGAIVYTPGYNSDGRDFAQDPAWQAIARQWQFALVGVEFQGPFGPYFDAASGSGQALLTALQSF